MLLKIHLSFLVKQKEKYRTILRQKTFFPTRGYSYLNKLKNINNNPLQLDAASEVTRNFFTLSNLSFATNL